MKDSVIALTVAAALGLGAVPAFARDHGGPQHAWQGGYQQHEQHRDHDRRGGWEHRARGYYAPRYSAPVVQYGYAPGFYGALAYGSPGYYAAPGYYEDNDDSGDVIGAAVLGAVVGAALASHH